MQNKIWKINMRKGANQKGGRRTKNPKSNMRGRTIIWNWRVNDEHISVKHYKHQKYTYCYLGN